MTKSNSKFDIYKKSAVAMHKKISKDIPFPIIGESPSLMEIFDDIDLILWDLKENNVASNVLFIGETGTGKELFAQLIGGSYDMYPRKKPEGKSTVFPGTMAAPTFAVINCAEIPEKLAVSTLFGHVKGAATGLTDKIGLIHENAAAVFLDEIQELKGEATTLLLRFMESGEYRILGDSKVRHSSCKIIAATNRKNYTEMHANIGLPQRFDEIIDIPPLNERREDIPLIVQYLYEQYFKGKKGRPEILELIKQDYLPEWQERVWTNNNIRQLRKEVIKIIKKFLRDKNRKINVNEDDELPKQKSSSLKKVSVISYIKCFIDTDPKDLNEFKSFWMENHIDRSCMFYALKKAIDTMRDKPIGSDEFVMVEEMIKYFQEKGIDNWSGAFKTIMNRFDKNELRKCIVEWNETLKSSS